MDGAEVKLFQKAPCEIADMAVSRVDSDRFDRCIRCLQLLRCGFKAFFLGVFLDSEAGACFEKPARLPGGNTQVKLLADFVKAPLSSGGIAVDQIPELSHAPVFADARIGFFRDEQLEKLTRTSPSQNHRLLV